MERINKAQRTKMRNAAKKANTSAEKLADATVNVAKSAEKLAGAMETPEPKAKPAKKKTTKKVE